MFTRLLLPEDLTEWPPENDLANIEYKSRLTNIIEVQKWSRLVTQMRWRLAEGADLFKIFECVYVLGVYDDGQAANLSREELSITIDVIEEISKICEATVTRMTFIDTKEGQIAILYIKSDYQPQKRFPIFPDNMDPESDIEDDEDLTDIID